jgi:hypothetical protein
MPKKWNKKVVAAIHLQQRSDFESADNIVDEFEYKGSGKVTKEFSDKCAKASKSANSKPKWLKQLHRHRAAMAKLANEQRY